MSDTKLNQYIQYGTAAERAAFTPSPPQLGGNYVQTLYLWKDTDDKEALYWWDGAAWELVAGGGMMLARTADPASPANGDVWVVASGVSPTRTLALKIRDGGVTVTLASVTV